MSDLIPFADARQLTDRIKAAVEGTWQLIREAYTSRTWESLGYASWDEYCSVEFGTSQLRLPREERQEIVGSLREAGLSIPAIASATGMSVGTVHGDLSKVKGPERITGVDGRSRPASQPPRPAPRPAPSPTWYAGPDPGPLPGDQDRADREVAEVEQRAALRPVPAPTAPADPHAEGDARRDAELEAVMENTASRFRLNFSTARGHSKAVWQFDIDRIAEVYAAPEHREHLLIWIREMRHWCDQVTNALDKTTTLRSVGGNQ